MEDHCFYVGNKPFTNGPFKAEKMVETFQRAGDTSNEHPASAGLSQHWEPTTGTHPTK